MNATTDYSLPNSLASGTAPADTAGRTIRRGKAHPSFVPKDTIREHLQSAHARIALLEESLRVAHRNCALAMSALLVVGAIVGVAGVIL